MNNLRTGSFSGPLLFYNFFKKKKGYRIYSITFLCVKTICKYNAMRQYLRR